jgi:uncharacterized coiled-coil DUF342 family protein
MYQPFNKHEKAFDDFDDSPSKWIQYEKEIFLLEDDLKNDDLEPEERKEIREKIAELHNKLEQCF